MNTFNWTKALGFGLLIWAIMSVVLFVFGNISAIAPLWAHTLVAVVGGIAAYFFAGNSQPENATQALGYALVWAAMAMGLDFAITQWFDADIFTNLQSYLPYALVAIAPLLQIEARKYTASHA
jgi:hypothetical protein